MFCYRSTNEQPHHGGANHVAQLFLISPSIFHVLAQLLARTGQKGVSEVKSYFANLSVASPFRPQNGRDASFLGLALLFEQVDIKIRRPTIDAKLTVTPPLLNSKILLTKMHHLLGVPLVFIAVYGTTVVRFSGLCPILKTELMQKAECG
jgi:hypothetical protein